MKELTVVPENVVKSMCTILMNDQGNYISHYLGVPAARDFLAEGILPKIVVGEEPVMTTTGIIGRIGDKSVTMFREAKLLSITFGESKYEALITNEYMKVVQSLITLFVEDKFYSEKKNGMQFQRELMDLMSRIYRHAMQAQIKLQVAVKEFHNKEDVNRVLRSQTEGIIYFAIVAIGIMNSVIEHKVIQYDEDYKLEEVK